MSEKLENRRKRRIRSYLINPSYQLKCVSLTAATGSLLVIAVVAILLVFIRGHFLIWASMVPMSDELQLRLDAELRQVVMSVVSTSFAWIALLCLFSIILSHRTAGPLYRFQRVFEEIRAGNLDKRITLRPHDDFHEVAQSFNAMMETLRVNREKDKAQAISHLDDKAFGMVTVLVAAAIGSVVMLSMSTMMSNMNHSLRGSRTVASRDQLTTKIAREAGNPASLKTSLQFTGAPGFAANTDSVTPTMFEKCVNGSAPNGCVALVSGAPQSYGFTLTDVFSAPIAGPSDSNAAVYDVSGAPCPNRSLQAPTATCQILVTTTFTPKCSNAQPSCAQASSITVNYTLYQADVTPQPGMPILSLKPITQSVTVPVPFPGTTTGAPNYLAKWVSNTQIGISQVYEDALNNVGIGTSSPSHKLEIQESRTDTSGQAITMLLKQYITPPAPSSSWFTPLVVEAVSSGNNQNLNPGTTAIIGETNWDESSASVNSAYGIDGAVRNVGTGTVATGYGVEGKFDNLAGGSVTTAIGVQGRVNSLGTGPINTAYAGHFEVYQDPGASLPANGYGVHIGTISGSNKWSMYAADSTAPSFFAGNVGIGTTTPAQKLDVYGNIAINGTSICTSSGCTSSSDRALKENIQPLQDSLAKVLKLQGVEYDYKDKAKFTDKHQVGVIAQDVEKVYPEVVLKDPKTGLRSVAYDHLVGPLIEAFKSLYSRVIDIESQQAQMKADNAKLKQEYVAMKAYLCSKDQTAPFCR